MAVLVEQPHGSISHASRQTPVDAEVFWKPSVVAGVIGNVAAFNLAIPSGSQTQWPFRGNVHNVGAMMRPKPFQYRSRRHPQLEGLRSPLRVVIRPLWQQPNRAQVLDRAVSGDHQGGHGESGQQPDAQREPDVERRQP